MLRGKLVPVGAVFEVRDRLLALGNAFVQCLQVLAELLQRRVCPGDFAPAFEHRLKRKAVLLQLLAVVGGVFRQPGKFFLGSLQGLAGFLHLLVSKRGLASGQRAADGLDPVLQILQIRELRPHAGLCLAKALLLGGEIFFRALPEGLGLLESGQLTLQPVAIRQRLERALLFCGLLLGLAQFAFDVQQKRAGVRDGWVGPLEFVEGRLLLQETFEPTNLDELRQAVFAALLDQAGDLALRRNEQFQQRLLAAEPFLHLSLNLIGIRQHFVLKLQRGLGLALFDCPRERELRAFMGQGSQPDGGLFGSEPDIGSIAEIAAALGHHAPDRPCKRLKFR